MFTQEPNTLEEEKAEPQSINELEKMLGEDSQYVNIVVYNNLKNLTFEKLFSKPCVIILLQNQERNSNPVGHYIALIKRNDSIEHFDPYGLNLEQELAITHEPGYLKNILNQSKLRVQTSNIKFQILKQDTQTCGRWVVARCKMAKLSLQEFRNFFEKGIVTKDDKVTLLTYFL